MHNALILPLTLSSKKGDCQQFWVSLEQDVPCPSIAPHARDWENLETCNPASYRNSGGVRLPDTYHGFILWRGEALEHNNTDLAGWVTYPERIVLPSPVWRGKAVGEVRYSVGMPFDSRCVSVRTNADKSADKWLAAAIEAVVIPAIDKHKAHLRTVALEMLRNRFADQIRDMRKNCDKLESVAASVINTLEG